VGGWHTRFGWRTRLPGATEDQEREGEDTHMTDPSTRPPTTEASDQRPVCSTYLECLEAFSHSTLRAKGAKRNAFVPRNELIGAMYLCITRLTKVCRAPVAMQIGLNGKQRAQW